MFTGHAREDTSAGVVGSEFGDIHGSEADVSSSLSGITYSNAISAPRPPPLPQTFPASEPTSAASCCG